MTNFEKTIIEKQAMCTVISDVNRNIQFGYEYACNMYNEHTGDDEYYAAQIKAYEKIFSALEKLL